MLAATARPARPVQTRPTFAWPPSPLQVLGDWWSVGHPLGVSTAPGKEKRRIIHRWTAPCGPIRLTSERY